MRKLIGLAAVATIALSGCVSMDNYKEESKLEALDSQTYRLELYQPWMKQEVRVREAAREDAVAICNERGQGMQPLSTTSDRPSGDKTGATVTYVFRCVGFMKAPEGANVFRRLGFYTSEESKAEAYKEMEEYEKEHHN